MASSVGPCVPLHQVEKTGFDCETNREVMQPSSQRKPYLRLAVAVAIGTAAGIMGFFVFGSPQGTTDSTISFDLACIKKHLSAHGGDLDMVTDCEVKNRDGGIGNVMSKIAGNIGIRSRLAVQPGIPAPRQSQVRHMARSSRKPKGVRAGAINMRLPDSIKAKMDTKASTGAAKTLQDVEASMPDILARDPNWDLFAKDFTFTDQAGVNVKGLGPTKIMLKVLQEFHDRLVNTMGMKNNFKVETEKTSVTDLDGVIRSGLIAKWTFEIEKDLASKSIMKNVNIPFVPEDGGLPLTVSGTSTLLMNGDGKVESMTIDAMSMNKELSFPQWAMVDMKGAKGHAKKAVSILLTSFLAFAPLQPALAARSGGRMGGGGMRSPSMSRSMPRSAPRQAYRPPSRTNVYVAPMVSPMGMGMGMGYGYSPFGMGYGGGGGAYLGLSLVESLLRAQERQAMLQQQLRTQEELGKDQAQIAQIQAELAQQNALVSGLRTQQGQAVQQGQLPAAESPEMAALINQLKTQQAEIEQLKAAQEEKSKGPLSFVR